MPPCPPSAFPDRLRPRRSPPPRPRCCRRRRPPPPPFPTNSAAGWPVCAKRGPRVVFVAAKLKAEMAASESRQMNASFSPRLPLLSMVNNVALTEFKPLGLLCPPLPPLCVSLPLRPPPDLIACELDARVVLDLPQALVEAFPLVGLAKFVFVLLVRQKILWAQKRAKQAGKRQLLLFQQQSGKKHEVPQVSLIAHKFTFAIHVAAWSKSIKNSNMVPTSHGSRRRRWGTCWRAV